MGNAAAMMKGGTADEEIGKARSTAERDADKEKKSPKGITVSFKSGTLDKKGDWVPKSVNNPSKMNKTTVCAKDPARSFKRVAKCIKSQVSRTRPDLVKPALARWTKYHRALKRAASKKK